MNTGLSKTIDRAGASNSLAPACFVSPRRIYADATGADAFATAFEELAYLQQRESSRFVIHTRIREGYVDPYPGYTP